MLAYLILFTLQLTITLQLCSKGNVKKSCAQEEGSEKQFAGGLNTSH